MKISEESLTGIACSIIMVVFILSIFAHQIYSTHQETKRVQAICDMYAKALIAGKEKDPEVQRLLESIK